MLMGLTINQDVLGLIGIAVSVVLFIIGYRQTIGAANERVDSANKEIERILVRRIVLETYTPSRDDVARLLAGKARDFRVKVDDLTSEVELFTAIFTRIFESDLIPSAQRDEILARLEPVIADAERETLVEGEQTQARQSTLRSMAPLLWVALAATAIGGIVVLAAQPDSLSAGFRDWALTAALTVVGSLAAIVIFVWIVRFRAGQGFDPRGSSLEELTLLEKKVVKILSAAGQIEQKGRSVGGFGYDYLLTRGGSKILVQVKLWRRQVPQSFINEVISRIEETTRQYGASEAIVVTTIPVSAEGGVPPSRMVRFMSPGELRDYLGHSGSGSRLSMPAA